MKDQRPHEHRTCGAKTRNGTPCKRAPVPGRTRCRLHGGLSLAGVASPSFRTGRYSKYMPEHLRTAYETALADPDLVSLRSELALLDSRISELLKELDVGEERRKFGQVAEAWQELKRAQVRKDRRAALVAAQKLDRLLNDPPDSAAVWAEVAALVNLRRKTAAEERRRLVDLQQMMTVEQVLGVGAALVQAVRRHVHDRNVLADIQQEFSRLLGPASLDQRDDLQA